MNWDAIGAIGEILGSIAVLISLVYLAIQIRSNTDRLRFEASQSVANSADRGFDPIYYEPCMSIWIKGQDDYEALSAGDQQIFHALMVRNLNNFQSQYHAVKEGYLDADVFRRTHQGFYSGIVSSPGGSQWFKEGRHMLTEDVQAFLTGDR
jgi:hypothetical protein